MDPRKYLEAFLEYHIAALEAQLVALRPFGWPVEPLGKSYSEAAVHAALLGVWDGEIDRGRAAYAKALADHAYGQRKLDHLYV